MIAILVTKKEIHELESIKLEYEDDDISVLTGIKTNGTEDFDLEYYESYADGEAAFAGVIQQLATNVHPVFVVPDTDILHSKDR